MNLSRTQLDQLGAIRTVDITTIGRKTGMPHRIEIWWFRVNGRFVITGTPGRRDWLANVLADPRLTVHADGLDIEALARPVVDRATRMEVFTRRETSWYSTQRQLEVLVDTAPMIEVEFVEARASGGASA